MAGANENDTIAVGGTAQDALPADPARRVLCIQALDEDIWVNLLGTAAVNAGFIVYAGQARVMTFDRWPSIRNAVSVVTATAGSRYAITSDTI